MMTSSKWKYFRVAVPLYGEFTGHRLIPLTKACDAPRMPKHMCHGVHIRFISVWIIHIKLVAHSHLHHLWMFVFLPTHFLPTQILLTRYFETSMDGHAYEIINWIIYKLELELELEKCLLDKKKQKTSKKYVINDTYRMFYVGRPLPRSWAHRWRKSHPKILQYMNRHRAHEVLTFCAHTFLYATNTKTPHLGNAPSRHTRAHNWHSYNEGKTVVSKGSFVITEWCAIGEWNTCFFLHIIKQSIKSSVTILPSVKVIHAAKNILHLHTQKNNQHFIP